MAPTTTAPDAATTDQTDAYERSAQTFPVLPAAMADRVARFGTAETVADGNHLFRRGERSVDFFLVRSGAVDILDHAPDGSTNAVHRHGANQFTGELDLFNDRKILVSGRADGDTAVVRVPRASFRALIAAEPDIGEIIMRAFILRRVGLLQHEQGGVTLVGPARGADTVRLNAFLTRNGYPHQSLDTESDPDADGFLRCFELGRDDLPVVVADGQALRNPTNAALADAIGLTSEIDLDHRFDLIVVGAGPAGLAAGVYAASEGLDTAIIEGVAPGGQAGTSSKIENYLGFPTGISGQALAGRAQTQAQKFGARILVSRAVAGLDRAASGDFRLTLDDGRTLAARSVIAATGARYRRLPVEGLSDWENSGVHYAATAMEANLCRGREVVVVGGGNSAGQAAVFLSRHAAHVHMLVRGEGLKATMSSYLVDRIEASDDITLHPFTEARALGTDGREGGGLDWVEWETEGEGRHRQPAGAMFAMIGAQPNSDWLAGCARLDERGFVLTGEAGGQPFATSVPGLFAVGDVRAGSVKRVASGVGEGSVVVQFVHKVLAAQDEAAAA